MDININVVLHIQEYNKSHDELRYLVSFSLLF